MLILPRRNRCPCSRRKSCRRKRHMNLRNPGALFRNQRRRSDASGNHHPRLFGKTSSRRSVSPRSSPSQRQNRRRHRLRPRQHLLLHRRPCRRHRPVSGLPISTIRRRYPRLARRNGDEGTVMLRVLVTRDGRAAKVELDKTSGSSLLDGAAMDAVKEWRFVPARKGTEPVEDWVRVPIVFRLVNAQ